MVCCFPDAVPTTSQTTLKALSCFTKEYKDFYCSLGLSREYKSHYDLIYQNVNDDYYLQLNKNGHDEYCFVCEEPFPHFSKEDVYPCRVCTRAFHKKCVELLSDSECSQFDKETMDRRHTNSGWSCYKCVSTNKFTHKYSCSEHF